MENPAPKGASLASVQGSTGVDQDRGMCEEKRNDDHPEEDGTLNSGSPVSAPLETIWLQRINDFQRNEGVVKEARDSDPPIVVRDGNADHTASLGYASASMAKGRAERQSGQSTHARERNTPDQSVSRTLSALRAKAEQEPEHRFRGLSRLLDHQMLREAFARLKRKAAPGIDGMVHAEYAQNLDERLAELELRLKAGRYRATCVKRRWIAKPGSSKMRPLGIPVLEDKIVQQAVKMILESIWEAEVHQLLYKWLNRRSQRRSMTWRNYSERWKTWNMPVARVMETFPSQTLRQSPKPA